MKKFGLAVAMVAMLLVLNTLGCGGDKGPICASSVDNLDFDAVQIGSFREKSFTVKNAGDGNLLGTVTSSCSAYQVIGTADFNLRASESATFVVRFTPAATGPAGACSVSLGSGCKKSITCTGSGLDAPCLAQPAEIHFPDTQVGQSSTLTFTLKNTSAESQSQLNFNLTTEGTEFTVAAPTGFTLGHGQERTISVSFRPQAVGDHNSRVNFGTACAPVPLSGKGVNPQPLCQIAPDHLDFGTIDPGTSKDLSLTVTNSGTATLTGNLALAGTNAPEFSIQDPGPGPISIAAGANRDIKIRFTPGAPGDRTANLEFGSAICPSAFPLTGRAGLALCEVTPGSIDFGTCTVGVLYTRTFTIRNSGDATLEGSVASACPDLQITGPNPHYVIPPSQSVVYSVRYQPSSAGNLSCLIQLGNSGCSDVQCTAVAQIPGSCQVNPLALDFGTIKFDVDSPPQSITVRNNGGQTLQSIVVGQPTSSEFVILSGGATFDLPAGQEHTVSVKFHPTAAGGEGSRTATLTCCDATVHLSGIAAGTPQCQVEPNAISFGNVDWGSSRDTTFTLTNVGTGTLAGTISQVSCSGYTITSGAGSLSLSPSQSVSIGVRYSAIQPSVGVQTCTVNALGCTVAMTANATQPPMCAISSPDLAGGSLNFGSVSVGSSATKTLTIRNTGGGTLSGTVRVGTGGGCGEYSLVTPADAAYSLTSNTQKSFNIKFTPQGAVGGATTCSFDTGSPLCADVTLAGTRVVDDTAPAQVKDLKVKPIVGNTSALSLAWTAVGDDGNVGRATSYKLEISGDDTLSWQIVSGTPVPQSAGAAETFQVNGLAANSWYWFRIRAIDDVGNAGAVSSDVADRVVVPLPSGITISEAGWVLTRIIDVTTIPNVAPQCAAYNPNDGRIYFTDDASSRFYVAGNSNTPILRDYPVGPGDLESVAFFEDKVYFTNFASPLEIWSAQVDSDVLSLCLSADPTNGLDDASALAIATADLHGGSVLAPGEALALCYRSSSIVKWNPVNCSYVGVPISKNTLLDDPKDLAIGRDGVWLTSDPGSTVSGRVWQVLPGFALQERTMAAPIAQPRGIVVDHATGDLLIVDYGTDNPSTIYRVRTTDGQKSAVFSGFVMGNTGAAEYANIDITPDGNRVIITETEKKRVFEFTRTTGLGVPLPGR